MLKLKKHFKIASKIGRKMYYCLKSEIKLDLSHEMVYNDILEERIEKKQKKLKSYEQTWKKKRKYISWETIETSLATLGIKTGLALKFLKKINEIEEIIEEG